MAEQEFSVGIKSFGGLNIAQQEDELFMRSHRQTESGFTQVAPIESPNMWNMDYAREGIAKRQGSAEEDDISGVIVSGEVLIRGTEWSDPASGSLIQVIVGKKSIYTDQSGSWAQINTSTSGAYEHAADVTLVSFAKVDGHLFIGVNGANQIQAYRNGADLDEEMSNGNTYEFTYGATDVAITGTWPDACHLIAEVQNRLVFSDGDTLINYTPEANESASGIFDYNAGGFFQASGHIKSLNNYAPKFDNSLSSLLYIGTSQGMEVMTGFSSDDTVYKIEGSEAPLNHQCAIASKNWLVYLTESRNIYGINKTQIIDLGRRLKSSTKDGPLDNLYLTTSLTSAFGFYWRDQEQMHFYFTTGSTKYNDTGCILDFKLGEPVYNEPQSDFEKRVRCSPWDMIEPITNDWFANIYQTRNKVLGIGKTGYTYELNSGDSDFGTTAINGQHQIPAFNAGTETLSKQWMMLRVWVLPAGDWDLTIDVYFNRRSVQGDTFTIEQLDSTLSQYDIATYDVSLYGEYELLFGRSEIDDYTYSISWNILNRTLDQGFTVVNYNLRYLYGAEDL